MKKSLPYVIRFFGSSGGNFAAHRDQEGLDVYSPIPGTRAASSVQLIGFGASIKNYVTKVHMVSVKKRKRNVLPGERYPFDRLSCVDGSPVGGNRGAWWSTPILEFKSQEHMNIAIEKLVEENPVMQDNVFTIEELRNEAQRLVDAKDQELGNYAINCLRVLKELEAVHINADRDLPHMLNDQPLRFSLSTSMVLFRPSSSTQDAKGYYTNVSTQARANISNAPTPGFAPDEPLGD